jgi:hypothetical protein
VLQDLIEGMNGEPVLVAYNFRYEYEMLKSMLGEDVPHIGSGTKPQDLKKFESEWNQGKIEVLLCNPACLVATTEVLTEKKGWVRIIDVDRGDRVYDGVEFVSHDGCHFSGNKPVVDVFGIKMTENHKILIDNKWIEAKDVQDIKNARKKALYKFNGAETGISRVPELQRRNRTKKTKCTEVKSLKKKILQKMRKGKPIPYENKQHTMEKVAQYDKPLQAPRSIQESRGLRPLEKFYKFLRRYARNVYKWVNFRPNRQRQRIFEEQLPLGVEFTTATKQEKQSKTIFQRGVIYLKSFMPSYRYIKRGYNTTPEQRVNGRRSYTRLHQLEIPEEQKIEKVYDLVNCGKRNRFIIRNSKNEMFISHNSVSHGLNLQQGGHNIIWFGLTYSWEQYTQLIGRLHRQGQVNDVRNHVLLMKNTIDEAVFNKLQAKEQGQRAFLDALYDYQQNKSK